MRYTMNPCASPLRRPLLKPPQPALRLCLPLTLPLPWTILPDQANYRIHKGRLSHGSTRRAYRNRLATLPGALQSPRLIALHPAVQFNRSYPPCCRTADKILFVGCAGKTGKV